MNHCHAYLVKESPFYDLFENGMAPIKAPLPQTAECIGDGVQTVYLLDFDALTPEQIDEVVSRVATVFHAGIDDVRAELLANGLPIRSSQITGVSFPARMVL